MSDSIRVTAIEPIDGYKRRVTITDMKTGEEHTVIYGDSVTDAQIRHLAPLSTIKQWGK